MRPTLDKAASHAGRRRIAIQGAADPEYRQLWRVVDGAVASALDAHPEFIAPGRKLRTVRNSIVKRVTGAIHSHAAQAARARSGSSPASVRPASTDIGAAEGAVCTSSDDCPPAPAGDQDGEGGCDCPPRCHPAQTHP